MASRSLPARLACAVLSKQSPSIAQRCVGRRKASSFSGMQEISEDIDSSSSLYQPGPSPDTVDSFNPVGRSKQRARQLPASRYQFRPPKYNRGPLHPHQSPPASSPSSRVFIPGPFSLPRLEQTYQSTLAQDLLTLSYTHHPPGTLPGPSPPRLRSWDDSSPYHKNRPLRGPRGAPVLPLLRRPITFRNVPSLSGVTVHSFVRDAGSDSAYLHVAGMVLQAITNVRCTVYHAKQSIANFNLREGKAMAVKCELKGEDSYHFLSKLVEVVMPKIKDYKGVSGGSGDGSGNLALGFGREVVGTFPEIEVNYDA
ncbi:hypothetical protein MMC12_000711 [Toensbergia leucococca]|nr:hypothetical protein [Toensbergia leucococca]